MLFAAAVTFCDKMSLYGFYPFHRDKYNNTVKYHYYDKLTMNFASNMHKMPDEFAKLTKLHEKHVIRLVTDKCTYR